MDTVFIVFKKSWRQLSFLHVYHHCTIFLVSLNNSWFLVRSCVCVYLSCLSPLLEKKYPRQTDTNHSHRQLVAFHARWNKWNISPHCVAFWFPRAVLLAKHQCGLWWGCLPDNRAQWLHSHRHVHVLLRQHAHQGHMVEKVPHTYAGVSMPGVCRTCVGVVCRAWAKNYHRCATLRDCFSWEHQCCTFRKSTYHVSNGWCWWWSRCKRRLRSRERFTAVFCSTAVRMAGITSCLVYWVSRSVFVAKELWMLVPLLDSSQSPLFRSLGLQMIQFVCMTSQAFYLLGTGWVAQGHVWILVVLIVTPLQHKLLIWLAMWSWFIVNIEGIDFEASHVGKRHAGNRK